MASYYPPSIATAINSQESTWGVQYAYIPSTTTGTNTTLTGKVLNRRTRTNGAFDPSGSPPRTLPKVNFDSGIYYGSSEGTTVTATPTVPAGSGFYAWAATFVAYDGTSSYYLIAAGSSSATQKWSVSSSGKLSITTFDPRWGGYQVWIAVARKYKVTCEQNYGTVEPTILYGQTTLPTLTREGYRFDGWYSASTGGTKIGDGGSSYTPTADITIYAHWTQILTISFNANGGTGAPSGVSVAEGGQWTCPSTTPTKSNSNFAGWAESQSATPQEVAYYPGSSYPAPSADLILYAVWVAEVGVIIFNTMGGTISSGVYYKVLEAGEQYGELPIPIWGSISFVGWFTAEIGGTQVYPETQMQGGTNVILYAHYEASTTPTYQVFFNADGGTPAPEPITRTDGEAIGILPAVTREGFVFLQWTNSADGTAVTAETMVDGADIYAVAVWTRHSSIITFNADGGTGVPATETVPTGSAFGRLPVPEKVGSNFEGWYNEDGEKVEASDSASGDETLTARWSDGTVEWFKATKAVAGAGSL